MTTAAQIIAQKLAGAGCRHGFWRVYRLWLLILEKTELNRANAFSFLVPVFGLSVGALFFKKRLVMSRHSAIGMPLIIRSAP